MVAKKKNVVELRSNYLSFTETIGQSIANISPTLMPALSIPLIAASAGNGTWLVFVIATIGLILVGLNISVFARRFATSGSMYTYVTQSMGQTSGFLTGFGLLIAYLLTAMAVLVGSVYFGEILLKQFGLHVPSPLLYALGAGIIGWLAYKDIKLSSIVALLLEFASVTLITVLGIVVMVHNHFRIDMPQLSLHGVSFSGITLAMVLAVFSYVGFDSAATLGKESRNPQRSIPRAIIISTAVVGVFFAISGYMEILGYTGGVAALKNSSAPLNDLANQYHLGWFGLLTDLAAVISFFSCSLASINAASRIMFTMSRNKILAEVFGRVHPTHQTPYIAVLFSSGLNFLVPSLMVAIQPMNAYGYLATFATYGFMLAYLLISVAAPLYLNRKKNLKFGHIVSGAGGFLFILVPVVGSVYPVPAAPYNLFPYFFVAALVVAALWFKWRQRSYLTDAQVSENMEFESLEEIAP